MKKEFWENLSPTENQSELMLKRIREKSAAQASYRRPVRIAAVLAAVLVMTTLASVVAAPAMIRYFVPHLGMVEVPESTENTDENVPYLFLKPFVSQTSGNRYRLGYMYKDTAYVYIYTPLSEEVIELQKTLTPQSPKEDALRLGEAYKAFTEKILALETENLKIEEIQLYVCNESTDWERMAEYKLTFTGLDAAARENGISFMGDTIHFETMSIEYKVYKNEYQGITLSLIPLANDYSVFACSVTADETTTKSASLIYDERHMTAGYSQPFFTFVDAHGHRFKAQMVDNIIYLDPKKCDVPITKLVTNALTFTLTKEYEGKDISQNYIMTHDWSFTFN